MPVLNPSDLFVSRNRHDSRGVVVVPLLEGSGCILAELQALVTQSFLSMPRRVVLGLDANRLNLVLAVLEKEPGVRFGESPTVESTFALNHFPVELDFSFKFA